MHDYSTVCVRIDCASNFPDEATGIAGFDGCSHAMLASVRTAGRLPIVGVMGSGMDAHAERSVPLGRWLAGRGVHLLTGGGGGVMAAVSRAFFETPERKGLVLGVVPSEPHSSRPRAGYPNQWVELPIYTHLPLSGASGTEVGSRNHINVLTASVIVALPGGAGTASEASLAVRYGKPIVAFVRDHTEAENLPSQVQTVRTLDAVCTFIDQRLSSQHTGIWQG